MLAKHINIAMFFRTAVAGFVLLAMILGTLPISHTTTHAGHHHHGETNIFLETSDKTDDDCVEDSTHQHISTNEHTIGFLSASMGWHHRLSMTERLPLFVQTYSDQDFLYEHERPPREYHFI